MKLKTTSNHSECQILGCIDKAEKTPIDIPEDLGGGTLQVRMCTGHASLAKRGLLDLKIDEKISSENYVKHAIRTEACDLEQIIKRINDNKGLIRLVHASEGMCTEAGEFTDSIKKHIFYGKELDYINLVEELGDLLWYAAVACSALDVSLDDVMRLNIEKLRKRYPDKFSESGAVNRDLEKERIIFNDKVPIKPQRPTGGLYKECDTKLKKG